MFLLLQRNRVQLFDFGLARRLPSSNSNDGHTFQMTGMVGSLRFMAPEVMLKQPYNQAIDVYSFSIVLWEMLACEKPYAKYKHEKSFVENVCFQNKRPRTTSALGRCIVGTKGCQSILKAGWERLHDRSTAKQMCAQLEAELRQLRYTAKTNNRATTP